jgi:hypothetical protein
MCDIDPRMAQDRLGDLFTSTSGSRKICSEPTNCSSRINAEKYNRADMASMSRYVDETSAFTLGHTRAHGIDLLTAT